MVFLSECLHANEVGSRHCTRSGARSIERTLSPLACSFVSLILWFVSAARRLDRVRQSASLELDTVQFKK
jgi:hypothetical protein